MHHFDFHNIQNDLFYRLALNCSSTTEGTTSIKAALKLNKAIV